MRTTRNFSWLASTWMHVYSYYTYTMYETSCRLQGIKSDCCHSNGWFPNSTSSWASCFARIRAFSRLAFMCFTVKHRHEVCYVCRKTLNACSSSSPGVPMTDTIHIVGNVTHAWRCPAWLGSSSSSRTYTCSRRLCSQYFGRIGDAHSSFNCCHIMSPMRPFFVQSSALADIKSYKKSVRWNSPHISRPVPGSARISVAHAT